MRLHTRLRQLEQILPDPGCPACRDRRGRIVFVDAKALADGTIYAPQQPQVCPICKCRPERLLVEAEPFDTTIVWSYP